METTADLATLYPRLLRHARRYTDADEAQDVVQDAFVFALPRLDMTRNPASYLIGAVRFAALHRYEYRRARPAVPLAPTVAAPARDDDAREALAATLARLAAERHGPLLLAFARGATLRELAEAEGVGVATIKTRIFRLRAALGPCPLDD